MIQRVNEIFNVNPGCNARPSQGLNNKDRGRIRPAETHILLPLLESEDEDIVDAVNEAFVMSGEINDLDDIDEEDFNKTLQKKKPNSVVLLYLAHDSREPT